jgi:monovalent cation/hydrogen antiporter
MGVTILSLIATSIGLLSVLRGLTMPTVSSHETEEDRARMRPLRPPSPRSNASSIACRKVRSDADVYVAAASQTMDLYRTRIANRSRDNEFAALARRRDIIESELLLAAVKAERRMIFGMAKRNPIGSETARKLVRELDLAEARYQP